MSVLQAVRVMVVMVMMMVRRSAVRGWRRWQEVCMVRVVDVLRAALGAGVMVRRRAWLGVARRRGVRRVHVVDLMWGVAFSR